MRLGRWRPGRGPAPGSAPVPAGPAGHDPERARRFRELALPHFDEIYTLACYLARNAADAEDAVQECYLRAFQHFDSFRGTTIKPWLMAILRNVCRAEYARRMSSTADAGADAGDDVVPLWQEPQATPELEILRQKDSDAIRKLLQSLPGPFREVLVLREINDLSYRDIAEVIDVPVGTVMSRLARARAMLREGWLASDMGEPS